MTLTQYTFEGGTDGANATTANTGASLQSLSGGTAKFSAAAALDGALGLELISTGSDTLMRFDAAAANKTMAFEIPISVPTEGSVSNAAIATIRNASGVAFRVNWAKATHLLAIDEATVIGNTPVKDSLTPGTMYRLAVLLVVGTTTTNGYYSCNLYAGNSTTPLNSSPITKSTANLGTAALTQVQIVASNSAHVRTDTIQIDDGRTTEIGPPSTLPAATSPVNVYAITDAGDYTLIGDASTAVEALSDSLDDTGVETPDNPSAEVYIARLAPISGPPGYVKTRWTSDTASYTVKIELLQGATVIAATDEFALGVSAADYTLSLTSGEQASITTEGDGSVNDLDVRVTVNP